jgi:hypothetical protein
MTIQTSTQVQDIQQVVKHKMLTSKLPNQHSIVTNSPYSPFQTHKNLRKILASKVPSYFQTSTNSCPKLINTQAKYFEYFISAFLFPYFAPKKKHRRASENEN